MLAVFLDPATHLQPQEIIHEVILLVLPNHRLNRKTVIHVISQIDTSFIFLVWLEVLISIYFLAPLINGIAFWVSASNAQIMKVRCEMWSSLY